MKRLAFIIALLPSLAFAQAFRVGSGIQIVPRTTCPTKATANAALGWHTTKATALLCNPAGTLLSVPSGAVSAKGDMLIFGGTTWQLLAAGTNSHVLTLDSSTASGVKWAPGGGAASLGNWVFTGDAADLSGAGAMSLGGANATAISLLDDTSVAAGKSVTAASGAGALDFSLASGVFKTSTGTNTIGGAVVFAANKGVTVTAGTSAFDFSGGSGVFKTSTGAATFGGSSNTFTNGLTTTLIGSGASLLSVTGNGFSLQQSAVNATPPYLLEAVGGAHTNLLSGTEIYDVYFDLSRTVQHTSGALATQRALFIDAPTYSFTGSSTITNAATVAIGSAPVAGTNATITNAYALWVQAGTTALDGGAKITGSITGTYNIAGTPTATSPILANLGATTVAPTWSTLTYTNSWVDFGASSTSRYTKDATGLVTLEVKCKSGSSSTAAVATLPVGYRPGQTRTIPGVVIAGTFASADVGSNGVITPIVSSTSGIFFVTQFMAEN